MRLRLIEQIDNDYLNLDNLLKNKLKAAPQGPKKLAGNLLKETAQSNIGFQRIRIL